MPIYKMKGSKDGKQKYRVRINYTDSYGENRQLDRVAYGSSEAKDLERKLLYEIKTKKPAARMTVGQLYNKYTEAIKHEIKETSYEKTCTILTNHVLPYFNDKPLDKLTAPAIQNWKLEIEKKGLQLRTKQNIYSCFRAMLNWGVKLDFIPNNILMKVGNFKSADSGGKHKMDFYTSDEYLLFSKAALDYAKKSNTTTAYDYYVFFSIAFYCGLRKGEIHALKWSDIDGNYLNISRSISQKLKGKDAETPPKNKSSVRTLQLPQPLIDILSEHKERWESADGFCDDFRICGGTRPLRDTSVENMNRRFAKAAGIKKIRIHDFRHSHVSLLANSGINIQEIARRLGHSDIKMTWNTYAHLYPKEEERAIEILNKIV